jgi:hypothetical protein
LPFGRLATMGMVAGRMLEAGASVMRKWLIAPESRMAQLRMVSMSTLIVFRRTAAAKE